jgi:uncharacterized protein
MHEITTLDELLALYGRSPEGALTKEQPTIAEAYRALIEASPFCSLATVGPDGLDCTPRGDQPGFVKVVDERTLEMPDRRGNNRLDSLRNIVNDPRVALLFLIPGRNETMRVNGRAVITTDPETLKAHAIEGKAPATVVRIAVETCYFQCGKAPMRSNLWNPDQWADISELPTTGAISASFRDGVDVVEYDRNLEENLRSSMF